MCSFTQWFSSCVGLANVLVVCCCSRTWGGGVVLRASNSHCEELWLRPLAPLYTHRDTHTHTSAKTLRDAQTRRQKERERDTYVHVDIYINVHVHRTELLFYAYLYMCIDRKRYIQTHKHTLRQLAATWLVPYSYMCIGLRSH